MPKINTDFCAVCQIAATGTKNVRPADRSGARKLQQGRQCKENHGFPAGVQKVCRAPEKGKTHENSYDSSWDFGALEGTRIPGPLIKRTRGASFVNFWIYAESLYLIYHRYFNIAILCIICIQCNSLQPLSSYSGVQKVCKNVQTGKTKPNGQINHRFYGRV